MRYQIYACISIRLRYQFLLHLLTSSNKKRKNPETSSSWCKLMTNRFLPKSFPAIFLSMNCIGVNNNILILHIPYISLLWLTMSSIPTPLPLYTVIYWRGWNQVPRFYVLITSFFLCWFKNNCGDPRRHRPNKRVLFHPQKLFFFFFLINLRHWGIVPHPFTANGFHLPILCVRVCVCESVRETSHN